MAKGNDRAMTLARLNNERGLSLIELIVISVVIAIVASMAFPTYKIFQQRSKEKRLKKILTDVRAAISGAKSHNSTTDFQEGFRTIARVKAMEEIVKFSNENSWNKVREQNCLSAFVAEIGRGYGYPKEPKDIWSFSPIAAVPSPLSYKDENAVDADFYFSNSGNLKLEMRFYRNNPIHPFHDWYPECHFAYVPVTDNSSDPKKDYSIVEWEARKSDLLGVKDIVSRGAGLSLDGSNTDDW